MSLQLTGTIKQLLPVQSGVSARGNWSKQEFILEYQDGNYPKTVCMYVFGDDKVNDLRRYRIGETVTVSFNLSSREVNGRWYHDIQAWRIESPQGSAPAPRSSQPTPMPEPNWPMAAADNDPF